MKRFLIVVTMAFFTAAALWAASSMSIQVSEAQMRGTPSFFGTVVVNLVYGDRVEVLQEGNGWIQVRDGSGRTGWIQESALTTKKVVLSSGGNVSSGASTEEVALAGKGFNKEIESEYQSQTDLDFAWVDRMEEYGKTLETLVDFLEEGNLEGVIE